MLRKESRLVMRFELWLALLVCSACQDFRATPKPVDLPDHDLKAAIQVTANATPLEKVNASAIEQTTYTKTYDASYARLDYPNGDVPKETGVCADVIVRAFRAGGVDLQKELHDDMSRNFAKYPQKWRARRPDRNIDHRRVPNLMVWFERQGRSLSVSQRGQDYLPGDVVSWGLADGRPHIGIVSKIKVQGTDRYAVVHNIGYGARLEDVLFAWGVSGHYRYFEK